MSWPMVDYVVVYKNKPEFKGLDVYLTKGGELSGDINDAQKFDDLYQAKQRALRNPMFDTAHLPASVVEFPVTPMGAS